MTEQTPRRRQAPGEILVEMARLKGLSDGVVAFALTLLVLDIRVPPDVLTEGLPAAIGQLGPAFAVYLISFVLIGGAWGSHQRMLGQIERGDGLMVWWTLLSLLPVTLVPASAALLGDHPGAPVALVVFALDVVAIQVTGALLWRHASRQVLIDPELDPRVIRSIGRRLWFAAICFAVSIPIALVNVPVAYAVWLATFALIFTTDWLSWQQSRLAMTESITLEDTSRATIRFEHGSGNLSVEPTGDPTVLVEGSFGGGVSSHVTKTEGSADVRMSLPTRTAMLSPRYPWAWGLAALLDWDIALNPTIPIELEVVTSTGRAALDLEHLRISRTEIAANACTVEAILPAGAGRTTVLIQGNASRVVLHVPEGVAAAITFEGARASMDVDLTRFPAAGKRDYRSPDYETAINRVDIRVQLAFGSLRVVGATPGTAAVSGPGSQPVHRQHEQALSEGRPLR